MLKRAYIRSFTNNNNNAHYLAYTCTLMYPDQKVGLGPDQMTMQREGRQWMDVVNEWKNQNRNEFLRNETIFLSCMFVLLSMFSTSLFKTVESIVTMWRTTEDIKWQEHGYAIFKAIEKHTRTRYAYTGVEGICYSIVGSWLKLQNICICCSMIPLFLWMIGYLHHSWNERFTAKRRILDVAIFFNVRLRWTAKPGSLRIIMPTVILRTKIEPNTWRKLWIKKLPDMKACLNTLMDQAQQELNSFGDSAILGDVNQVWDPSSRTASSAYRQMALILRLTT